MSQFTDGKRERRKMSVLFYSRLKVSDFYFYLYFGNIFRLLRREYALVLLALVVERKNTFAEKNQKLKGSPSVQMFSQRVMRT